MSCWPPIWLRRATAVAALRERRRDTSPGNSPAPPCRERTMRWWQRTSLWVWDALARYGSRRPRASGTITATRGAHAARTSVS